MSNADDSIIRFGDDTITALSFIAATNYVLAPHGSPIWQGSADELAALVRDARRFRKMAQAHDLDNSSAFQWCRRHRDQFIPLPDWLAEIADALPDPTSDSASGTPPQG